MKEGMIVDKVDEMGLGRGGMVVLGILLCVLALAATTADPWLRWSDFMLGLVSIGTLLLVRGQALRVSPFACGGVLMVLGIVALALAGVGWLPWTTLLFGVTYMVLGIAGFQERTVGRSYTGVGPGTGRL